MAQTVWKIALDSKGWPIARPQVFLDFTGTATYPDGAVTDAAGNFWNAQWGPSRVAAYAPNGSFRREVAIGAPHAPCPAFGGPNLTALLCTTAQEGMDTAARAAHPHSGKVFVAQGIAKGQKEHLVIL